MITSDELTEAIVTCNVQFSNWVSAYNRLKSCTNIKMDDRSLIDTWMIFSARKRMGVTFSVIRRKSRNLDVESVCAGLYPELRHCVDRKWLVHCCPRCSSRLVIMDGDAKAYRFGIHASYIIIKDSLQDCVLCRC